MSRPHKRSWHACTAISKRRRRPSAPQIDLSPVAPDLALLQANRTRHTVTWIGHSTVLVQTGGRNLITDPMFSRRASPLPFTGPRRHQPPGIALRDLPPIDLVLISHNHYDHLDLPSVRALSRQRGGPPSFAVPLGLERWFRRRLPMRTSWRWTGGRAAWWRA